MGDRRGLIYSVALMGLGIMAVLCPLTARGAENAATVIGEAKAVIEKARQAGAEKTASADLAQAKSWLAQAEKEYEASTSILSRTMKLVVSNEAQREEILYLADMARTKGRIAEAKARKASVSDELKEVRKDLAEFQTSLEVMNKNLAEAKQAKGVQAEAEVQLKALAQAKQEVALLEKQQKKELEETQKKAAELEALRQKELQQARLQEAQKASDKDRLASQKEKEAAEMKAKEEQLAAERQKMAAMQKKMAAMEKEKTMFADAAKIPQASVRIADRDMVISLPVVNLFTAKNELHPQGKAVLDGVGSYLKRHSVDRVAVRGHTDSMGKAASNQSLSEQRAQKVKEYLVVYQNIPSAQVSAEGLGSSQPVANNTTEAGRALNRRVEVAVPIGQ